MAASGYSEAEHRLPPMAPGTIVIPVGPIIFGWTAQKRVHYIVPIGSTNLVGFGFGAVFLASSSYLVDASEDMPHLLRRPPRYCGMPLQQRCRLAGPPLFARLGLGLGATVLGLVALVVALVPLGLMRYEQRMRKTNRRFQVPS